MYVFLDTYRVAGLDESGLGNNIRIDASIGDISSILPRLVPGDYLYITSVKVPEIYLTLAHRFFSGGTIRCASPKGVGMSLPARNAEKVFLFYRGCGLPGSAIFSACPALGEPRTSAITASNSKEVLRLNSNSSTSCRGH